MANLVQRNAGGYNNGYESDILARPELQFPREDVVRDITKQVKDVVKVKDDNYTPKSDKEMGTILAIGAAALIVAGIVLAALAISTGFGAGAIAVGAALGFIAYKILSKADAKVKNEEQVELVHDHAMHHRIGKVIQQYQDTDAAPVGHQRGRPARQRDAFVFNHGAAPAPVAAAAPDWMSIPV
jgi:hypothetical protein